VNIMIRRATTIAWLALLAALTLAACGSSYSPGPLANSTACGVLTADQSAGDTADINTFVQGENPFTAGDSADVQSLAEANVLPGLLGECQNHPAEVLSAAYNNALAASPALASSAPAPVVPDATTAVVPPAMASFVVTDSTRCSAIDDWYGNNGTDGPVDPKDAAIYDGSTYVSADPVATYLAKKGLDPIDQTTIATNCSSSDGTDGSPDETVAEALKQATP
jgi:hypothetical protein